MRALSSTVKLFQIFAKTSLHVRASIVAERRAGQELPIEDMNHRMLAWANDILGCVGVTINRAGAKTMQEPGILIGNHISYVDIPLMMSVTPTVFVSKAEVGNWPVLGPASKRIGTVLVKRTSSKSRVQAIRTIREYLKTPPRHLTIFPAGTTSMTEHHEWRWRIFEVAAQSGVKVQPFRLRYSPIREVAFVEKDLLVPHLWKLLGHEKVQAYVEFGEPFDVSSPIEDAKRVRAWTRQPLLGLADGDPTFEPLGNTLNITPASID